MSRQVERSLEGVMGFKLPRIGRAGFRKSVLALTAAASLATVMPQQVMAGGWNPGAAAAFGIIGGLALGAAIANHGQDGYNHPRYYQPHEYQPHYYQHGYGAGGWYHHPHYAYAPPPSSDCYVVRERVWIEGWGWDIRARTVCE